MATSAAASKPKTKLKAILVLSVILVAVLAGAYYYFMLTPHAPSQFSMTVNPPSFHAAAGGGVVLLIRINRMPGFTSAINVALSNPPSWVNAQPIVINSTSVNATMLVPLSSQAPKGSYQLTVVGSAPGSSDQTVMVSMKVVGVSLLANENGSALVYDTTKTLDSETLAALVNYVNGTFQFSQSTAQLDGLEPGDVIAESFNATRFLPNGCLRTVLDVRTSNGAVFVDTRVASLIEAAQYIHITNQPLDSQGVTSSGVGMSTASFGRTHPLNALDACDSLKFHQMLFSASLTPNGFPAQLGGTAVFTLSGSAGLCLGVDANIDIGGIHWFVMGLFGHEGLTASIVGKHGDQFNWNPPTPLETLFSYNIPILPPIFNGQITLTLEGRAFGTLYDDVNSGITQSYDLTLGLYYNGGNAPSGYQENTPDCTKNGWNACLDSNLVPPTPSDQITPAVLVGAPCSPGPSSNGGNCARVELGPRLSIGVNGNILIASVQGNAWGEVDLFWELDTQPQYPIWSLYMGLTGNIGLNVSAGFNLCVFGCYTSVISVSPSWNIGDVSRTRIDNAPNYPPPTPLLLILNSASTVDLSNPGGIHGNTPLNGWAATMGADPQGEAVTCIWMSKEVGQLATTMTRGNGLLACPGPTEAEFYNVYDQIASQGLDRLTITVVAEDSAGKSSLPSNAVTVKVLLPTPQLQILCAPCGPPGTTIIQNQPFTVQARATLATVVSSQYPNGIIDLCQTAPQRLQWGVNFATLGPGPQSPYRCSASLTIFLPGTNLIEFFFLTPDLSNIATDSNGNFIITSVTVNVQASTSTPPPSGATTPTVTIIAPIESAQSPQHTQFVNNIIMLQGTVSGGTPPYTATWTATYSGNTYTIGTETSQFRVASSGPFPDDSWNIVSYCSQYGFVNGLVSISLSVTDSNQQTGVAPNPGSANISCVQTQTIAPMPDGALVSLLTVLFALTAERKTILQGRLTLRILRTSITRPA